MLHVEQVESDNTSLFKSIYPAARITNGYYYEWIYLVALSCKYKYYFLKQKLPKELHPESPVDIEHLP